MSKKKPIITLTAEDEMLSVAQELEAMPKDRP